MKLCKDCEHFRAPPGDLSVNDYARCLFGLEVSPVTGKREIVTQNFVYAIGCRQSTNAKDCGPDGRHFKCGRWLFPDDEENSVRCGDEGRLCETCSDEAQREHAWMRDKPLSSVTGVLSDEDKQDLRAAGRAHLVQP